MLSEADNELVTRVGRGTPMGTLMREYWVPAMLSSELPGPDCDPVRVLLLGEQLIGFRDTAGQVGLISNLCPHRGASLFYGRNEEGGIRCVYHGWKFDVAGKCLDMPNEPPNATFKERIRATTYPCVERAGIVWTYMGPRQTPPPMPPHEVFDLAEGEYDVGAGMRSCNWLQGLEGDLDTSHVGFLHSKGVKPEDLEPGTKGYYMALHKDPKFVSVDTDFGAMYGAYRPAGEGELHWRIANFLMPFYAQIPDEKSMRLRMWVPMDDTHTMFFQVDKTPPEGGFWHAHDGTFVNDPGSPLKPNTTDWYGRFNTVAGMENDYFLDRNSQRTNEHYSGISGIWIQDHAITESMGPFLDRSNEHLGSADMMVIRIRRRLIGAAKNLVERGAQAPGVDDPEVYRTRPANCILPADADWLDATAELRAAAEA